MERPILPKINRQKSLIKDVLQKTEFQQPIQRFAEFLKNYIPEPVFDPPPRPFETPLTLPLIPSHPIQNQELPTRKQSNARTSLRKDSLGVLLQQSEKMEINSKRASLIVKTNKIVSRRASRAYSIVDETDTTDSNTFSPNTPILVIPQDYRPDANNKNAFRRPSFFDKLDLPKRKGRCSWAAKKWRVAYAGMVLTSRLAAIGRDISQALTTVCSAPVNEEQSLAVVLKQLQAQADPVFSDQVVLLI